MAIEALLERLCAAVEANTEILLKIEAGREAALEQLQSKTESKPSRKKKTDTEGNDAGAAAAGSASAPAASPSSAPPATETTGSAGTTEDDLRAAATAYIGTAGDDKDKRQALGANIKSITDHFGTKTLVGPDGIQDAEQRAQALFYIKRFEAGLEVNFSAEYDFSADPTQGSDADAAGDDGFDIG